MIKLIHLSDFHLKKEDLGHEKIKLIEALIKDFKNFVEIDEKTLLIVSGDLIDKGGQAFDNKDTAYKTLDKLLFKPLIENFPLLKEHIFIVPGNHDLERESLFKYTRDGLVADINNNYNNLEQIIIRNREENKIYSQQSKYKNFEKEFYSSYSNSNWSFFDFSSKFTIADLKIGVSCLNSSWMSFDDNDFGNLIIGKTQIEKSLEFIEDSDFKIAIFHHPIDFVIKEDKQYIEPLLHKNYDLILNGHTHLVDSSFFQGIYGCAFRSISTSILGEKPKFANYYSGYSIIEIYPNDKFIINFRKYRWEHKDFVINTDIGDTPGKMIINVPNKKDTDMYNRIKKTSEYLRKTQILDVDNDLIIHNVDDSIPNTINDIFVEPPLGNMIESNISEEEMRYYSIDEIIKDSENFLIYGTKESGKTILLDKIFIESTKYIESLKKIPVIINFDGIGNRTIYQLIRSFLSVSLDELKEINKEYEILLIIDNLCFPPKESGRDQNLYNLNKIIKFKNEMVNIQVIATSTQELENIIPDEFLEYNDNFNFNLAFIHTLKTKQIRSLIKKWFVKRDVDFQENLEKLLKNFQKFGLPRTPLSVTMFLWIINKQEKEPVNNAVLVELFTENLLEKANFDNVFSSSFDFHNKKRLLSKLALEMFNNGKENNSYSLSYSDTFIFFEKYLENKFGDPRHILENLVKRKILCLSENNFVRFKTSFFFHYFLSLNINDKNPDFKKKVYDNVLEFSEEIEYYTGLNRDDDELFDFIISELDKAFDPLNKIIISEPDKIDKFLETTEPLSEHVDFSKITKKPNEKELDVIYDKALINSPIDTVIEKKDLSKKDQIQLDKILKLSACVLKNSEEIDDFNKRSNAYSKIIKSSISFFVLYRHYLLLNSEFANNQLSRLPNNIDPNVFLKLLPIIHQVIMFEWLGSIKLQPVLSKKLESDLTNDKISNFESFLTVFIYSDLKAKNHRMHIEKLYKNSSESYILDAIFFKTLTYYYLRSKNKNMDEFYLDLIFKVKKKLGQITEKNRMKFRLLMKKGKKNINMSES